MTNGSKLVRTLLAHCLFGVVLVSTCLVSCLVLIVS